MTNSDWMTPREVQIPTGSARELTRFQQDVLIGTLLGDGSIAKHGYHHRLFVKHSEAQRPLVEWKYEVFANFTTMKLHSFDQLLKGGRYPCVQFVTRTDPVFSRWRDRFYRDRRKIVPSDIEDLLSPDSIAVWLMDDGTAERSGVSFQTHGFEIEEAHLLAKAMRSRFELETSVMRNKGAGIVYVHRKSLDRLGGLLEGKILPEFAYKLIPRGRWTP